MLSDQSEKQLAFRNGLKQAREDYERYGFCTSFAGCLPEVNVIGAPVFALNGDRAFRRSRAIM
ncbi:hypothetical protein TW80_15920 [Loktanella sp. S4079]|nr:hypothetical protein TW80_15920 [Loktanella sp. S4079]